MIPHDYGRPTSPEEQLYSHWIELVAQESPQQMTERFRCLFVEGIGYPDREVWHLLCQIVSSPLAEQRFRFVLNRCCYILINRWQTQIRFQPAIADLVDLFEQTPTSQIRTAITKRLRELIRQFIKTEQYLALRRLAQVLVQQNAASPESLNTQPLGILIPRYPYLYRHCLLSEDEGIEQRHAIQQIQTQAQRKFDVDLSRYITYQQRRSHDRASGLLVPQPERIIHSVTNPTLLTDYELNTALREFMEPVAQGRTCRDLAQNFVVYSSQARNYRTFKDDLYEYLTASVDTDYGSHQFNQKLRSHLSACLAQSEFEPPNELLRIRTVRRLLDFLVASPQKPHHLVFLDLTTNLGATATVSLLLKLLLICRQAKPYLERRFSLLFKHYETCTHATVEWLVKTLENLNVAFSTHFSPSFGMTGRFVF